jgi:hypothetical protein
MNLQRRLLVGFVIGGVIAAGAIWFYATHERVPDKAWVGPSGEARVREFLAAERFVERMGLRAAELRSLPEVDALAAGGVLIMPNRRQSLDPQRIERLLAWVQGGGHLIVEAELAQVSDPLLEQLEVRRSAASIPSGALLVELPGEARQLKVVMVSRVALEPPTGRLVFRAAIGNSIRLASFTRGRGMVTVAASLNFARNFAIGDEDHAELLWRLARATPARELAVYWNPQRLSLWDFLVEHAPAVLLSVAALLVAWLWRIAPRFGPVAPDAPPARRRLLDHLRASGRYFWAQGLRERLVAAARDAVLRRVARAQPEFAAAPDAERAERLVALAAVSAAEARRLLGAAGPLRGPAFIEVMQTAQRVHAALERGNR